MVEFIDQMLKSLCMMQASCLTCTP